MSSLQEELAKLPPKFHLSPAHCADMQAEHDLHDAELLREEDRRRRPNCFTVTAEQGFRPFIEIKNDGVPHVSLGTRSVPCDSRVTSVGTQLGAVVHESDDSSRHIRRANVCKLVSTTNGEKRERRVLSNPKQNATGILLRVSLAVPEQELLTIETHDGTRSLKFFSNVSGGWVVARSGTEALVHLSEGQKTTLFYVDGAVRRFVCRGAMLHELAMGPEDEVSFRIREATRSIRRMEKRSTDGGMSPALVRKGLVNLFNRFDGDSEEEWQACKRLVDYFIDLEEEDLKAVGPVLPVVIRKVRPGFDGIFTDLLPSNE